VLQDQATQAKEDALARANPQGDLNLLLRDAQLAGVRGQLRQARDLSKRAEEKAQQLDLKESMINRIANEALLEALVQNRGEAVRGADTIVKQSQTPTTLLSAADVYARSGEDARAAHLLDQAAEQRPDDVNVQSVVAPMIRAVLAMNRHDAAEESRALRPCQPRVPLYAGHRLPNGR
jgi:hypothetical protein